jgi:regulator of protease activity HflC (stomatin/prohibitin superfamily)
VLKASGEAEAAVVRANADALAQAARARGQAEAITTVFKAIHEGNPDRQLLAYQYLQTLPQIAQGNANKLWIVPSEVGKALEGLGGLFGTLTGAVGDESADGSGRQAAPGMGGEDTGPGSLTRFPLGG